jgi:hypothetical protein
VWICSLVVRCVVGWPLVYEKEEMIFGEIKGGSRCVIEIIETRSQFVGLFHYGGVQKHHIINELDVRGCRL